MTEQRGEITLSQAQLDAYWMPFTGNRQFKADPRVIESAQGVHYTDSEGRKVFDGLSGLWTSGLGHGHPDITAAISRQASQLDYAPAFQFGHPLAFELAERIVQLTPAGLDHVFYTGSGSESVETALKMARAYWHHRGQASKKRLVGRARGYHGVNFGGISVGGIAPNRKLFGQGLESDHLPTTLMPENAFTRGIPQHGAETADWLEHLVSVHDASTIAAVIVEPFAGSGGVIAPPAGYLQRLRELCDRHDILLIFDEVISGFGRIGAMTAAEAFGVVPDIMTLAKQLTNGVIPMGAVVASDEIYQTFMAAGGPPYMLEFPHGYTYSGHPIACAAALATLEIIEREAIPQRVAELAPHFEEALHSLRGLPYITDIRNIGLAGGLSIESAPGEPARRPFEIAMHCWRNGFYVRYGGDTIQIAPPFVATPEQLDSVVNAVGEAIEAL